MLNHDCVLMKQHIQHDYIAETDVSVLKYEQSIFQQILDTFPDFYEDLKAIIDDKNEQEENQKFVKKAMNDKNIRNIIVKHYKDLVNEEKHNQKRQN